MAPLEVRFTGTEATSFRLAPLEKNFRQMQSMPMAPPLDKDTLALLSVDNQLWLCLIQEDLMPDLELERQVLASSGHLGC